MRDLEALGFTVLEGYGLTETSPVLTFNPVSCRKPGSAGKPLPSVEMRILAPSDTGEGEIEVKGLMVMKGYYKNISATDEIIREGWFKTGDIGHIDRDGYLFITGRSKEVIVLASGKNIYPEDVEKLYLASPLLKEICILDNGSQGTAESLHAVIVPDFEYAKQAGISNIQDAIKWEINSISGKIPSYMRVTRYSITKELEQRQSCPFCSKRQHLLALFDLDAVYQFPYPILTTSTAYFKEPFLTTASAVALVKSSESEQSVSLQI